MSIKIALAGNPNSGKTTLFNALTGSNQFVGNWPGVTVEKKEGKLKNHKDVTVVDLPGIYSLSPYTPEEIVARNYLINEKPDVILNIVDASNLQRNLYLTTQLCELGIPVVIALNMMDIVNKRGDKIDAKKLFEYLGAHVVEISAVKGHGVKEAAEEAVKAAKEKSLPHSMSFSKDTENALSEISDLLYGFVEEKQLRWYSIKMLERDEKISQQLNIEETSAQRIEKAISNLEDTADDDSQSIVTSERYDYISEIIDSCLKAKNKGALTVSDKIDRVVTNRFAALPIFAVVMFLVYFISVSTVGTWATDWVNDGVFGDGWHLFGMGSSEYAEKSDEFSLAQNYIASFETEAKKQGVDASAAENITAYADIRDDEGNIEKQVKVNFDDYKKALGVAEPDPAEYGVWVEGVPVLVEKGLSAINAADWVKSLVLDGVVAGVGAVLGFVPQLLVLFLMLAFLEACGYMARIAFVLDRIFRKFGLSGKSFIPMLIGVGCGVPGIMASRTIENERDRRMTIMTTTFIPCSAKLPVIALISGAMFGGEWWVAPSAYFIGIAAIIVSGIMLKKTKPFEGDVAPFVMELPAYHWPTLGNILRSMWERASSFVKKAGTVIFASAVVLWFLQGFGFANGGFGMVENLNDSFFARIGNLFAWIFAPLGWGNWQSAVATVTGLIAKENVVSTFGVLYGGFSEVAENGWQVWENVRQAYTPLSAYSFLVFNLLCAPCFAAVGAIKREMNSSKWTLFAVGYQTAFAYGVSFMIYQFGSLVLGTGNIVGAVFAAVVFALMAYMLFKPSKNKLKRKTL